MGISRTRKLILSEQTPEEQAIIDVLKDNGWSDVDENGAIITAREFSNQKPNFEYKKVGPVILRRMKPASNTTSTTGIDEFFDCIVKVKNNFQIPLYKSRASLPDPHIYERLSKIIDGVPTRLCYFKEGNKIELRKESGDEVVFRGTWKCTSDSSYRICWDGKCSPVDVGMGGSSFLENDTSCCTGSAGTSGTSGGSTLCPSGYNIPCPSEDDVIECKASYKPCMKCSDIKDYQGIPALWYYIEQILKRENKPIQTDEYYGEIMKEAVEMLQSEPSRGLTKDGKIGCLTLKSIADNPNSPSQSTSGTGAAGTSGSSGVAGTSGITPQIKKTFQVDKSFFNPNSEW